MEKEIIVETEPACEKCGKKFSLDKIEWLTRHYPVCKKCYEEMPPEEIYEIIENFG